MEERQALLGNIQQEETPVEYGTRDGQRSDKEKQCGFYIPRRYILVAVLSLGTANSFAVRVNFNVALLAMVNTTGTTNSNNTIDQCPGKGNLQNSTASDGSGEFFWSPNLQSNLLSAFYYGYPLSQPFVGALADRIGGRRLIVLAGVLAGIFNLLLPVVARWNVYALLVLRVLLGFGLGPLWPSMACMIARWTRKQERTKLYGICNSGLFVGTVVSQSVSGVLCESSFLGGWPATFYVFGIGSLLWAGVFWLLTADSPSQHPSISAEEREMIENDVGEIKYQRPPYRQMITCVPLWAAFFMLFMDITSYDIIFTFLPLYMKRVLKYDIAASGGLASVPYVISMLTTFISGYSADAIKNRGWMSTMWIRRMFTMIGDLGPALCVLVIIFLNCNRELVVLFFIICVSLSGFNNGGFNVSMFDLAPRYAGTIYGFMNGLSNIGGFVGPLVVGALTNNSGSVSLWHSVFYIVVAQYAAGVLVFCIFGSADIQPWAEPDAEDKEHETTVKTLYVDEAQRELDLSDSQEEYTGPMGY